MFLKCFFNLIVILWNFSAFEIVKVFFFFAHNFLFVKWKFLRIILTLCILLITGTFSLTLQFLLVIAFSASLITALAFGNFNCLPWISLKLLSRFLKIFRFLKCSVIIFSVFLKVIWNPWHSLWWFLLKNFTTFLIKQTLKLILICILLRNDSRQTWRIRLSNRRVFHRKWFRKKFLSYWTHPHFMEACPLCFFLQQPCRWEWGHISMIPIFFRFILFCLFLVVTRLPC